jgi:hypothetical protein
VQARERETYGKRVYMYFFFKNKGLAVGFKERREKRRLEVCGP